MTEATMAGCTTPLEACPVCGELLRGGSCVDCYAARMAWAEGHLIPRADDYAAVVRNRDRHRAAYQRAVTGPDGEAVRQRHALKARQARAARPEAARDACRSWYQRNREAVLARKRRQYQANPERFRAAARASQARKRQREAASKETT